ncbi:NO-inducible flavohemoprotein [Lysinibacillus sp. 2017]|uniref:NO-inducible flavohemoprotein n=1 Tax=unclassified Lysinibacillus TaxID=2636778 RepID=UPI000D526A9A|nr:MULTISPECIES: NO-inducible flavohemoprotein [unclassified Lysinibacillus]AWE07584.1 NO-inducible flavohemoprotein [Lysinibacillus sp. 2017]TGN36747.1 NO-inducible flavohemoprotein [Lysinibacillus sp. S2017]
MLTKQTIDTIKATVPVLEVHGLTITKTFYCNLFKENPQLLNIFNHTNQKKDRQQTALANTVYAAAVHIENLEAIVPAVVQIAHKHVSLGILPEHYPIVGKYLLAAIKEVLGDAATDEIIDAWAQAYGVIADIFISVEEDLYKAAENNGGWRLFKDFTIAKIEQESDVVKSFYLQPADGAKLPAYSAGQYISIRTQVPGQEFLMNRQYTVTEGTDEYFRISVKREDDVTPNGIVSNFLHNSEVGTNVQISAPAGVFTLVQNDSPVLFISGGVGVTPLQGMLKTMKNRQASFIQCARNERVAAFKETIEEKVAALGGKYKAVYSETEGYVTKAQIEEMLVPGAEVYICGPTTFMESVIQNLVEIGVSSEKIHYEFFGAAMALQIRTKA